MSAPEDQLELFRRAVDLLGGQAETSRILGVSERHVRRLVGGSRDLHAGILEDVSRALIARADECRRIERLLSPAFAANLTEHQRGAPIRGNTAFAQRQLADIEGED